MAQAPAAPAPPAPGLGANDGAASLPAINPRVGALVSAALVVLIAVGEIDALCAQILLRDGHTFDPTGLTGPAHFAEHAQGWRQLAGSAHELIPALGGWLLAYGLLDCVFTAIYGWGLLRLVRWITPGTSPAWIRIARAVAVAAITADLVENLLIVALSRVAPSAGAISWIAGVLPWASTVKWVALWIAGIVILVRGAPKAGAGLKRALHSFYTHRYSAVIVGPIAVLGVAKGGDLIEQVPDIQRRWVQGELASLIGAGLVSALLAVAMFAIGRQRTHHLWVRREPAPRRDAATPPLLPWVLVPAAIVAAAAVNGGTQSRLWWFVALPVAIAAVSAVRRWTWGIRWTRGRWTAQTDGWRDHRPQRPPVSDAQFRNSALVGDLLPVALVVVMGLGAVRSATAVVAMEQIGLRVDLWKYVAFLAAGAIGAVLVWWPYTALLAALAAPDQPAGVLTLRRVARRAVGILPAAVVVSLTPGLEPSASGHGAYRRNWLAWVFFVGAWVGLLVVGLLPMRLAGDIGVIAAFQLGLGLGALMIAALVCALQSTGSPEAFWWKPTTLAFTPVTTLSLAILLAISVYGNVSDVHAIRAATTATDVTRPTIVDAVNGWMDAPSCTTTTTVSVGTTTADVTVRPMLLLAAEGGGIRAAYWTAAALDALGGGTGHRCRPFLASGASGGAVGLSIAAVSAPGEARNSVVSISGQEALTAASIGLLIRDLGYAATGIPLRSDTGSKDWIDRAGLIERVWETKVSGLEQPFFVGLGQQSPATGYLALNSTSATSLCRTLLSQVDLTKVATNGHGAPCGAQGGVPGSLDLLTCTGSRNRSTVALMASRFPYVTPSAVAPDVEHCGLGPQQIVDGGYAENTGIGTLVDLAPLWLPQIRAHNERVVGRLIDGSVRSPSDQLIVPVLVYFDNGTGSDLSSKPKQRELELLVPPLTRTAQASLADEPSNIARAEALLAPDQLWSIPTTSGPPDAPGAPHAVEAALTEAIRTWRAHAVVRVYQPTTPSVAAPLGWVLSTESQGFMDRALVCQAQRAGALSDGNLATLVTMLGGRC